MKPENTSPSEITVALDAETMQAALHRIAQEIVSDHPNIASVALLGILKRGRPLAERIAAEIAGMVGARPLVGSLATTLYRDDLRSGKIPAPVGAHESTHFAFNLDGLEVILVDDVLATGRTIRAALDEVMDYGRPKRIKLACLIDRGLRELPIQPDYCGWTIATEPQDNVAVKMREADGEDAVLYERIRKPAEGGDA
jgi:pyrimidine operon attenuation protein/uracil phosphoribosyltransferase